MNWLTIDGEIETMLTQEQFGEALATFLNTIGAATDGHYFIRAGIAGYEPATDGRPFQPGPPVTDDTHCWWAPAFDNGPLFIRDAFAHEPT